MMTDDTPPNQPTPDDLGTDFSSEEQLDRLLAEAAALAEDLSADLGEEYSSGVFALEVDGAWHGPIRSFFGVHVVRVTARTEARTPALEDIRERVVSAFKDERGLFAEGDVLADTYRRAFEADPISAFGGVLAFNRPVDEETAQEISNGNEPD